MTGIRPALQLSEGCEYENIFSIPVDCSAIILPDCVQEIRPTQIPILLLMVLIDRYRVDAPFDDTRI